jgi:hypothetical protein
MMLMMTLMLMLMVPVDLFARCIGGEQREMRHVNTVAVAVAVPTTPTAATGVLLPKPFGHPFPVFLCGLYVRRR